MPPAKDTATGKCAVPNCTSTKRSVTAHRFPKDPAKAEVWKAAIRNPDIANIDNAKLNKGYCVCTLHFSPDQYVPQTTKPMLRKDAFPTLLLPVLKDDPKIVTIKQENDKEDDKGERSNVIPAVIPIEQVFICGEPPTSSEHSKTLTTNSNTVTSPKRKRSALFKFVSRRVNFSPTTRYLYRKAESFRTTDDVYRCRMLSFKERVAAAINYELAIKHHKFDILPLREKH